MVSSAAFDPYVDRRSQLHRLDPRLKVVAATLLIFSNVWLPDGAWAGFLATWTLVLWANGAAGLGLGYTARRSLLALPFALAAVSALFVVPGPTAAEIGLGPLHLVVTAPGVVRFISVLVRSWLSVQIAILLVATTRFPEILHALHHLRVPRPLVATISLTYRYLFVLVDEASRLLRARAARSAGTGRRGARAVGWQARIAGQMVGQLFLRSYERSERIYEAMLARGYRGEVRLLHAEALPSDQWLVGAALLAVIGLIQTVGRVVAW